MEKQLKLTNFSRKKCGSVPGSSSGTVTSSVRNSESSPSAARDPEHPTSLSVLDSRGSSTDAEEISSEAPGTSSETRECSSETGEKSLEAEEDSSGAEEGSSEARESFPRPERRSSGVEESSSVGEELHPRKKQRLDFNPMDTRKFHE